MPKRFTATEIWSEDWFLDMPTDYKLFWFYMLAKCDHAGFFKVNTRSISRLIGVNLSSNEALSYFNEGKQRVVQVSESTWYVVDFFVFQYGSTFNEGNRVHKSAWDLLEKHNMVLTSIRGLKEVKVEDIQGVKDKDKDNYITIHSISLKAVKKSKKNEITNFNSQGYDLLSNKVQGE